MLTLKVVRDQFPADLVTFTEEILNGKLHFLCIFLLIIAFPFSGCKDYSTSSRRKLNDENDLNMGNEIIDQTVT